MNQYLDVSITNFMVGCVSLVGPSRDVVVGASGRVWLWLLLAWQGWLGGAAPGWCPGVR